MSVMKTEAIQKQITKIKQKLQKFGDARQDDLDSDADDTAKEIYEALNELVAITIAEIPPKEVIREVQVAVPAPLAGGGLQLPKPLPEEGKKKWLDRFLKS